MEDRRAIEVVRDRLEQGATWRSAAADAGLSLSTAYDQAVRRWPGLRGRRPRLAVELVESILRDVVAGGDSYRAIARRHNVSPDTVWRLARRARPEDSRPLPGCRRRRCPGCGATLVVWPCIACEQRTRPTDLDNPTAEEAT